MCLICAAYLLNKGKSLKVTSEFNGNTYELWGSAKDVELAPCEYQLSKNGEAPKKFISPVHDLMTIVSKGGFHINTTLRSVYSDEWIETHFD